MLGKLMFVLSVLFTSHAYSQKTLSVSFFQGFFQDNREFTEYVPSPGIGILIPRGDEDYKHFITGVGLRQELLSFLDMEFQTVYHYSSKNSTKNLEFVLCVIVHVRPFRSLKESWLSNLKVSFGDGLSQYLDSHQLEVSDRLYTKGLNNYMVYEISYDLLKDFYVLFRVHHRSTIFRLMGKGQGGTDFFTLGLKYDLI